MNRLTILLVLVLASWTANGQTMNSDAVAFVKSFFDEGKPVAAICHGPWPLIDADVVQNRTVTSWPSLKTDLTNAGAKWVDPGKDAFDYTYALSVKP